jgi:WhiB family redox-sensing transcriptional regulator
VLPTALAAREPYGVWGGFTEAERVRLLAAGWDEVSSDAVGWIVGRMEAELGVVGPRPILGPPARAAHVAGGVRSQPTCTLIR